MQNAPMVGLYDNWVGEFWNARNLLARGVTANQKQIQELIADEFFE